MGVGRRINRSSPTPRWVGFGTAFGSAGCCIGGRSAADARATLALEYLIGARPDPDQFRACRGDDISAGCAKLPLRFATLGLVSASVYAPAISISTFAVLGPRFASCPASARPGATSPKPPTGYLINADRDGAAGRVSPLDWPGPIKFAIILVARFLRCSRAIISWCASPSSVRS